MVGKCLTEDDIMLWFSFASLRDRLAVLTILAFLPFYAFVLLKHLQNSMTDNCIAMLLFATGAIAIVWIGSELLFLRWLRILARVSKQLANGNLQARSDNLHAAPTEVQQLAQTVNQMAESLEQQLTQLRHVEAQLTKANDRFRLASMAVNAIIYDWDIENNAIERTQGLSDVLGYQLEATEPTPNWWFERIHPEERQRIVTAYTDALANGSNFTAEYRIRHQDGRYLHIWDRGLIIRAADGRAVRVVGSCLDITERKQVEEKLRESEQRFYQIAENLRDVLWIATPDANQTIYVNPAYEQMWGYSCESLYAQPKSFLDGIHSEDRDRVVNNFNFQLQTDYSQEYRVVRPDGSICWVQSRTFPIRDRTGQVYRMAGLVEDITKRSLAEAEIKQLNATLEQRVQERTAQLETINRELDAFSYSVSHDLRAPLRHVRGFVDALKLQLEQSGAITHPKVERYIEAIQVSSQRMGQLIDGLLILSRVGRQRLASVPVNLRELVDVAIALVKHQVPDKHRSIEFIVGDLPTVDGDPALLQQVFSNLIDNAVKFSCDRWPAIIEIGNLPDNTVFVKDNGVGFQMEYADQLFGAFQRLHSQREFPGTGIGLAIVQRIIHRYGGTIWAESTPHQGATFYFTLTQASEE